MAGEFAVMERLYRLGHSPALTLGNAKKIDILVRTQTGNHYDVSVKACCGGGKWPLGSLPDVSDARLIYVLVLYEAFEQMTTSPLFFVIPGPDAVGLQRPWQSSVAIYYAPSIRAAEIARYRDRWDLFK